MRAERDHRGCISKHDIADNAARPLAGTKNVFHAQLFERGNSVSADHAAIGHYAGTGDTKARAQAGDDRQFATIAELAEQEGFALTYMARLMRLSLVSPEIVEAILDGQQGRELTLARLLEPFPVEWAAQSFHR